MATIRFPAALGIAEKAAARKREHEVTTDQYVPNYASRSCSRMMYQRISESILPDQIIRPWGNER